ncbi:hypothetical protein AB0F57_29935 [Streptomyces tanashiensis]|uniref:hypothetical protein n=1 Tax=Streptomyces tanashiensis TaxID=67367 RepID=UPI0033E5A283
MPSRRIRRAWPTAAVVASLAFTGLTAPAQAGSVPRDGSDPTVQEPLATEAAPSPFAAAAWSPGGTASRGDFQRVLYGHKLSWIDGRP